MGEVFAESEPIAADSRNRCSGETAGAPLHSGRDSRLHALRAFGSGHAIPSRSSGLRMPW